MNENEELRLLREAVLAKAAYWDANRRLERALAEEDIPDHMADAIELTVEGLAVGLPNDSQNADCVTLAELRMLKEELK